MVAEDKETGSLVVLDHKSKSLRAFKQAEDEMYRQQLLYSKYIYEHYGRFPDVLAFNLFKENGLRMSRPFSKEAYDAAMKWAEDTIHLIESYETLDFLDTANHEKQPGQNPDFFCQELCSMRKFCDNSKMKPKQ